MRTTGHDAELDRQLSTIEERYGDLAGVDRERLLSSVEWLRGLVPRPRATTTGENLRFVVVVRSTLVPTLAAVERLEVKGKPGWTDMADELDDYRPIEGVEVPDADAYLLLDVSTGPETLGVTPADALPRIVGAGRTPLTVDEGVAVLTHHPEVLTERNAFQALASRAGHKRVPSFWTSKGAPRLGWCWQGNPHSWLGAASAAQRLAP